MTASNKQRKPHRPSLASIVKQAMNAGVEIARIEVEGGKITIITSKGDSADVTTISFRRLRPASTRLASFLKNCQAHFFACALMASSTGEQRAKTNFIDLVGEGSVKAA